MTLQDYIADRIYSVRSNFVTQYSALEALTDLLRSCSKDDGILGGVGDLLENISDKIDLQIKDLDRIYFDAARSTGGAA